MIALRAALRRASLSIGALLACAAFTAQAQPGTSVPAPSAEQFARVCTTTEDLADCGRRLEALQLDRVRDFVHRDGPLLAIKVAGEPPYLFESVPGEAGPHYAFYAWHAPTQSVVLFRAKEEQLGFVLLHLPSGQQQVLPNEPVFNSDGRFFATIDFCRQGCENRLTLWRFERNGAVRERVFAPRTPWSDAEVSWGAPRRLIVDYSEGGRNVSLNLELNDPRWTVLLP